MKIKVCVGPWRGRAGRSISRGSLRGALAGAAPSGDLCQSWSAEAAERVQLEVEKEAEREAVSNWCA